jgi:plasmid stabilization system protein ParE
MESKPLKVVWTDPAKHDLQKIYDYLSEISIIVAEKQSID